MKKITVKDSLEGIETLWNETKGNPDVVVAILDGPVDVSNSSLEKANITQIDSSENNAVKSFHGTFVTSLIFSDHTSSVYGVAPDCKGLVKRIYHENQDGSLISCTQADIAQGIFAALDKQANVINISGGEILNDGDEIIPILKNALDQCEHKGVLVVAATGNEGSEHLHIPASYHTVLAVGSMNQNGEPSSFSNWTKDSAKHGILATGEDVVGSIPNAPESIMKLQGTSFSTALVSGVAALLASLQKKHGLKKDLLSVRKVLLNSATPCTSAEGINCDRVLAGRLNINDAMQQILSSNTQDAQALIPIKNSKPCDQVLSQFSAQSLNQPPKEEVSMSNETQVMSDSAIQPSAVEGEQQVSPSSVETQISSPAESSGGVTPSGTSDSSCQCGVTPSSSPDCSFNPSMNQGSFPTFENSSLVNAIGQPSYDFGIEANLDTFKAYMKNWYSKLPEFLKKEFTDSPYDHASMSAFLLYKDAYGSMPHTFMASQLTWLLNINTTPIYSITPDLVPFNNSIYLIMTEFLSDNVNLPIYEYQELTRSLKPGQKEPTKEQEAWLKAIQDELNDSNKNSDDVMRMVLPGYISGKSKLMSGSSVQSVTPVAYGLANWTVSALMSSMSIPGSDTKAKEQLISILNRLYFTTMNQGQSPDDRALNYSIHNIIDLSDIVKKAVASNLQFSGHKVVPSTISRQHSISREVQLTFFDPADTTVASTTYAMQIDVSGITPISVGTTQEWQAPISVAAI